MKKEFELCQHNTIRMLCPLCKDNVVETRLKLLIEDEKNVGKVDIE